MTRAWLRHAGRHRGPLPGPGGQCLPAHAQRPCLATVLCRGRALIRSRAPGRALRQTGRPFQRRRAGYALDQNIDLVRKWTDDPAAWGEDLVKNHRRSRRRSSRRCGRVVVFLLSDASRAVTGQTTVTPVNTALLFPNNCMKKQPPDPALAVHGVVAPARKFHQPRQPEPAAVISRAGRRLVGNRPAKPPWLN